MRSQFGISERRATDHQHLGQTLTYLVVSDARCIIWIAERIKEEHRAVIQWLNEVTPLDYAFFGVEIEIWRIGDSLPAPKFEIVAQPNTWERQQRALIRRSDAEDTHRRIDYWSALLETLPEIDGLQSPPRAPNQGWLKLPFAPYLKLPTGGGVYLYRMVGENRIGVYLSVGKPAPDRFTEWQERIAELPFPSLSGGAWERANSRIYAYYVWTQGNPLDEADWPRQHAWMIAQSRAFAEDWRNGLRAEALALCDDAVY